MNKMELPYVVHEYLHVHWVPMYFAQVAAEMSEHDLHFVGQLPAYLNYRDLAIPESLKPLFASVPDRLAFEGLKDYALNTYFRTDVFVKGRGGRDEAVTRAYLESTPFGALGDERPAAPREALLPNHTMRFTGPVFDALLPALDEGAASVEGLSSRSELAGFAVGRLREAMLHLVLGDRVAPLPAPTRARPVRGKLSVPSPYNRWLLERGFTPEVPIILATPAMGNGVSLTMVDAAGLSLALEPDASKHAAWIRSFCEGLTHLVVGERRVEDKGELEGLVAAAAERFRVERLPKLVELGVVACDEA
jgi:hypothetical protein